MKREREFWGQEDRKKKKVRNFLAIILLQPIWAPQRPQENCGTLRSSNIQQVWQRTDSILPFLNRFQNIVFCRFFVREVFWMTEEAQGPGARAGVVSESGAS